MTTSADVNPERRKHESVFQVDHWQETIKFPLYVQLCEPCQRSFIEPILKICKPAFRIGPKIFWLLCIAALTNRLEECKMEAALQQCGMIYPRSKTN